MFSFGKYVDLCENRADFVRLYLLEHFGGVYLDVYVLALRSFDALLVADDTTADFAMGREENVGLCNAVLVARTIDAPFVRAWRHATSRLFTDTRWNAHSVLYPATMAKVYHGFCYVFSHFFPYCFLVLLFIYDGVFP